MLTDGDLALEGVAADDVAADVEQVGVAADDLAVAKQHDAAALAAAAVQQTGVDRIQPVPHSPPGRADRCAASHLCRTASNCVNATDWKAVLAATLDRIARSHRGQE